MREHGAGSFCCHQYSDGVIEWYVVTGPDFQGRCVTQIHDKKTGVGFLGGMAFIDDADVPDDVVALLVKRRLLGEIQ